MKTRLLLLCSVIAFVVACGGQSSAQVAASIGGDEITVSQVNEALERFEKTDQFDQLAQQTDAEAARRRFEQAYLSRLIRRAVLRPQAEELGIEVTQEEIDGRLDQFKSQFPSETEFENAVKQQGVTLGELEDLVRDSILEEKIRAEVAKDIGPSQEELRDYYTSHRDEYRQTRVQHILVDDIGLARNISRKLKSAPQRRVQDLFAELAKKNSKDTSNKDDAGKLGWVAAGDLVPEFETAMNSLAIGEISDPVRSQFGAHVILVTGRRQQSLDQVSDQIDSQLTGTEEERAYTEFLKDALAAADVEVNPRYGEIDPETGQVVNATAEQVPGADESPSG